MSLNRLVLVLNCTYEEINIVTARHALKLLFKGAAVVEEQSKHVIHTDKMDIPIPDVIRLSKYRKVPRISRSMSRRGVLLRDSFTCQYCGKRLPVGDLTLDHVIPRARGGVSSWENLVTSCKPCNNFKGNRTPEEAKMVLARKPMQLHIHAKHKLMVQPEQSETWKKYMFAVQ